MSLHWTGDIVESNFTMESEKIMCGYEYFLVPKYYYQMISHQRLRVDLFEGRMIFSLLHKALEFVSVFMTFCLKFSNLRMAAISNQLRHRQVKEPRFGCWKQESASNISSFYYRCMTGARKVDLNSYTKLGTLKITTKKKIPGNERQTSCAFSLGTEMFCS